MPELPEVETIRRDLEERIVGRKILKIEVRDKKLGEVKNFARFLINEKITAVKRVGKLLAFELSNGNFLLVHLKMTGQLVYKDKNNLVAGGHPFRKTSPLPEGGLRGVGENKASVINKVGGELPNKHTRFILEFSAGRKIFFNDLRRFGYVKIVSGLEWEAIKNSYGIEPLQKNFTLKNLKRIFKGKKNVKAALLDQKNIAGIGNIYADEILFATRINPAREASSITEEETKKIKKEAGRIISLAIKYRGTTFSDYVDTRGKKGNFSNFLKVYGRDGEKCPKCGEKIKKTKIAGRGTHFCPVCQK